MHVSYVMAIAVRPNILLWFIAHAPVTIRAFKLKFVRVISPVPRDWKHESHVHIIEMIMRITSRSDAYLLPAQAVSCVPYSWADVCG